MTIFSKVRFYRIYSTNSTKSYIGSTTQQLHKRLSQHKSNKDCSSIHIIKSGGKVYIEELECVDDCDIKTRYDKEIEWMGHYDTINKKNKCNK